MNETLTSDESEAVLIALANRVSASLPLHTALTALAEESRSPRAQRVLRELDRRLQAGEAPDLVISTLQERLPDTIAKVLRAGLEIGRLDLMMQFLVNQKQWDRDFRHRLTLGFAYPTIILMFFGAWALSVLLGIVPRFQQIFQDFGTELPGVTLLLIRLSVVLQDYGLWLVPLLLVVLAVGWYWLMFGRISRLYGRTGLTTPIIGPMLNLRQFSEFCDMLAILIEGKLALPRSILFASEGLSNPELKAACQGLAMRIENGEPVEQAADDLDLPHSFSLVLRQPQDSMARDLRALSSIYATKGDFSIRALMMSVDVLVMVSVSILLVLTLAGLFLPLIKLLNDLS